MTDAPTMVCRTVDHSIVNIVLPEKHLRSGSGEVIVLQGDIEMVKDFLRKPSSLHPEDWSTSRAIK